MPTSTSSEPTAFHLFFQFPTEVRLAIWRECLPHRVSELDTIVADTDSDSVYTIPILTNTDNCSLWQTTYRNGRPPAISRVCRESRSVAFETGSVCEFSEDIPLEARWVSGTSVVNNPWLDRERDSIHLNWALSYTAEYGGSGSPLGCLAWSAAQVPFPSGGSLMLKYFIDMFPSRSRRPPPPAGGVSMAVNHRQTTEASLAADILRQLPSWVVVMRVVVVHADFTTAAATGLFGLLGDAPVQVVDVSDETRVNALFDLAEESERMGQIGVDQPFYSRDSVESMKQKLTETVVTTFGSEKKVPPMHPAIMFRLCTEMCNHTGKTTPPSIRGRGEFIRGRGRGRGRAQDPWSGRGRGMTRGGAQGAT